MNMYTEKYLNEIKLYSNKIDYSYLENKTICLSGGTGLIGSFLVDTLLITKTNCKVILLVRNVEKAKSRFSLFNQDKRLKIVKADLLNEIKLDEKVDYVLHLASLTDPYNYAMHPVEIMNTNFIGAKNLLDLASINDAKFLLSSTCEVYGKNENTNIKENDYGYIDILEPRSCYNESKKASETLCVCYKKEKGVNVVIARLSRVYGPTMKFEDTKAMSQFIVKALNNEDIVLKSKGTQLFNYTYVGDVVKAISILLQNENKHFAYNIANDELISLKDIASHIAKFANTKLVFDLPDEVEAKGYSKSLVSSLDASLFNDEYNYKIDTKLFDGLDKTLNILKE